MSAGNHAQAVAYHAARLGIPAVIVMPRGSPNTKVKNTQVHGAEVVLEGNSLHEAGHHAKERAKRDNLVFVHPYEDPLIIAGQGTIGLELAEQLPDVDTLVIPVGGGGLAAGITIALRALRAKVRLVGVQAGKHGHTIADGIAVKSVGEQTGRILEDVLDDLINVTDEEICKAIVLLLERAKLVVEGAGAVGVAALLADKVGGEGPVVALLSGGNIDPTVLISVMRHGLTSAGRYLVLRTRLEDRPGELIKLLKLVAQERANVLSVEHHREGMDVPVSESEIELTLTMRDEHHCSVLLETLRSLGYQVERLR
jgi:threonine dehydratase